MGATAAGVLSPEQVEQYRRDGYLLLEDALTPERLTGLRAEFSEWVEESRAHDGPYGETFDHRPRFDVEPGHSAEAPALRRVASPIEVSDLFLDVMRDNPALDAVSQLIGPNLRFRESKVNSKLPGTATHLKFH
ncbi:MAG: phytanoyl-CoA dioxygenase family protein, partial [Actinomycetota bacterium]|nr:phytanoyl-CoA dioxygenase family protein [Actinomycetota bacterium]